MSHDKLRIRLVDLRLADIPLERSKLLEDTKYYNLPEVKDFLAGLEKDTWTADELLRTFEQSTAYKKLTEQKRGDAIWELRRSIIQYIEVKVAENVEGEADATYDSRAQEMIEKRVHELASKLMSQQLATRLSKERIFDPSTVQISVPRAAAVIKQFTDDGIRKEEADFQRYQNTQPDDFKIMIASVKLDNRRREAILPVIARELSGSDELGLFTDLKRFTEAMHVRLLKAEPYNVEALMNRFLEILSDIGSKNVARQDPEYRDLEDLGFDDRNEFTSAWRIITRAALKELLTEKSEPTVSDDTTPPSAQDPAQS